MKYMSIRDLRGSTAAVRKSLARDGEIVVTANGKPIAVLAPVSPGSVEETIVAIRRARFTGALDEAHAMSKESGLSGMSAEEVDAVVREARKATRRRTAR
jgi:antitoxin (DNA-binding transcriptional repressor) of toxin-antitoxin stability system